MEVRQLHPAMGIKKIYYQLLPDNIGRDRFIDIGVENGLSLPRVRNYQRTTFSSKHRKYRNLTAGLIIRNINVIWVSDITYIYVQGRFYYITFIVDVYSRRILGYEVSDTLQAESSCRALKKAIEARGNISLRGMIHHSDRGSQYISNEYTDILKSHGIEISMCDNVYENTHMERVNGTIKNEYLLRYNINSLKELRKKTEEAVYLYNNDRIHWSLPLMPPVKYEGILAQIPMGEREEMSLWVDNQYVNEKQFCQEDLFSIL